MEVQRRFEPCASMFCGGESLVLLQVVFLIRNMLYYHQLRTCVPDPEVINAELFMIQTGLV